MDVCICLDGLILWRVAPTGITPGVVIWHSESDLTCQLRHLGLSLLLAKIGKKSYDWSGAGVRLKLRLQG